MFLKWTQISNSIKSKVQFIFIMSSGPYYTRCKAKRWGKKPNGLFGWITTRVKKAESKSQVNEVDNIPVENQTIFKLWGQRLKPDNSGLIKPLSEGNSTRN